ncbi:MAG: proline racemase family protein [Desulfobacterales bacterium]|nr:proline racemase family protein [Desulfobacterales bacterium]
MDPSQIQASFRKRFPQRIVTVDSHTQGEATRLVVGGVGPLPGKTMAEKCEYFQRHFDPIRLMLTREPRGHRDMLAAVVTEPVSSKGDFGLFYMDARRYPYLCGHATIGAVATLVKLGRLAAADGETTFVVDTPSGPLEARTRIQDGSAVSVAIRMVPSFVYALDQVVDVPELGRVSVDLVCVGGFFAMVDAGRAGIDLAAETGRRLVSLGMAVIDAANAVCTVRHPERPEVRTVDVSEFYSESAGSAFSGKSAVIYGESHIDRSPCGTGTTAKMTLLHHRGRLPLHQAYSNAGLLGTVFTGRLVKATSVGELPAVVGEVSGSAQITGISEFIVDPDDPFPEGFLI